MGVALRLRMPRKKHFDIYLLKASVLYCVVLSRRGRCAQAMRCDSPPVGAVHSAAASRASSYWRGRYTLRYVPQSEARSATELGMSTPGPNGAATIAAGPASVPPSLDVPIFMFPYRELILRTGKEETRKPIESGLVSLLPVIARA